MTPYEIISRKRDGKKLSEEEIRFFVSSYMEDRITDYQMSALLMAVYIRGMNYEETSALTKAYIESGTGIDLSDISGIKVDKHSTGGVGDKVSIILAPLVASLGVPVPMISGRGLGHSGGTLDKLESIPGFKTDLSIEQFRSLLKKYNLALIGQTKDIVPADKRIYALRDVTATVDSIPLISASIMSKKIAEGIDALVLDVKYGNGAFMKSPEEAEELAKNLIKIGKEFGKQVTATLTSMEQPLGNNIGNWLEIAECLECFAGNGPDDLMEVTYQLCSNMLILGGVAKTTREARNKCQQAISDGSAFEKFLEIVSAQGGDIEYIQRPASYPSARNKAILRAERSGFITKINTSAIGMASVQLGAGRLRSKDVIDPQAGIVILKKLGEQVSEDDAILEIHTNQPKVIDSVLNRLKNAIHIDEDTTTPPRLILKELK
jgi:pyrimidine-nucleoside phosphorylase